MKKRTSIAIILTIIAIILTNKYWFSIEPLPVSFDILGQGTCNVEVQLNKKDNDEFRKIKRESININLDEKNYAELLINRAKYPKRIRLILSNLSSNEPITISNIQFRNGVYTLENIEKFKVIGAKIVTKDNKLILIPDNDEIKVITLTYPDTLRVSASMDFDFLVFSIILILGYLLAYKLSNYVAAFNTTKGKSRIDIIFLTIFFIFLVIPMMHINKDDISPQENRTLAKWKPLITDNNKINFEFGNNFNEWFNDRFNLRQFFLNVYDLKLVLSRNWKTKGVIKGLDGWLFLGSNDSIDSYTNKVMFTDEELASIDNYLRSIDNYCKKHNKNFYFLIAPDKSKIYPEYYPQYIKKNSDNSRSIQLIDYIDKHSKVKIVYPRDQLLYQKGNNLLYWKQDTHWNLLGAYYGYLELMNMIDKDYHNLLLYKVNNYTTEKHNGDLYNMSPHILKRADKTIYRIPQINSDNRCEQTKQPIEVIICSNFLSDTNLLMYRDSFATSLIPYLSYTFGKSKYIWKYDVTLEEMQNANIIILEIVERNLPLLVNRYMEIQ